MRARPIIWAAAISLIFAIGRGCAEDNLRLTCESVKKTVYFGEKVCLALRLENIGTKGIPLMKQGKFVGVTEICVVRAGKTLNPTESVSPIGPLVLAKDRMFELASGKSIEAVIRLDGLYSLEPGAYSVTVTVTHPPASTGIDFRELKSEAEFEVVDWVEASREVRASGKVGTSLSLSSEGMYFVEWYYSGRRECILPLGKKDQCAIRGWGADDQSSVFDAVVDGERVIIVVKRDEMEARKYRIGEPKLTKVPQGEK